MTDVDRAAVAGFGGQEIGAHDVGDVDPVAGLLSVAKHCRGATADEMTAEDRHHPGLAVDVLPRPVDVAVAQRDRREPVQPGVEAAIALGRVFPLPVRAPVAGSGKSSGVGSSSASPYSPPPVERIDQPSRPEALGGLQHRNRSEHVGARVQRGMIHRVADVDLRRQVEDQLGPGGLEHRGDRVGIADVSDLQGRPLGDRRLQVLGLPGREGVDHRHAVSARDQRIDQVRADESGAACDQAVHGRRELTRAAWA